MKSYYKYIIFCLLILALICAKTESKSKPDYVDILRVNKEYLLSILDSVITYHKQYCWYYSSSLIITIIVNPDTNLFIIGANDTRIAKSKNILGYFEYNNHKVFIKGYLNPILFEKTGQRHLYDFYEEKKKRRKRNRPRKIEVIDETYPSWNYLFYENGYKLWAFYDGKCNPISNK